mmetsp:Transcript_17427/g.25165  ORF Transcript_17427/g.25165 Transcript_17427/m.25165 type:complete len:614 (-) Transcript_17427:63-1904(-)
MRMSTKGLEPAPETDRPSSAKPEIRSRFTFRRRSATTPNNAESSSFNSNSIRARRLRRRPRVEDDIEKRQQDDMRDEQQEDMPRSSTIKTAILTSYEYEMLEKNDTEGKDLDEENLTQTHSKSPASNEAHTSCATAILQHSFTICGEADTDSDIELMETRKRVRILSEDPTVQESIECVFASQLEDGLAHDLLWEETAPPSPEIISPAMLLQTRSSSRLSVSEFGLSPVTPKKTFRTGTLVHIGTYDPVRDEMRLSPHKKLECEHNETTIPKPIPCRCKRGIKTPATAINDWVQRPLMLRPTPGSGTRVKSIRFANSSDCLWSEGSEESWVEKLHQHWGKSYAGNDLKGCPECMLLPINNGNEKKGESLVIDFVSNVFEGSLLVRLRHTNGTTRSAYDDNSGYFKGVNRRYQVVVQGRPLREIPMTDCYTGLQFDRKFGKLPSKWIVKGALKVLSFFAPQLHAEIDGDSPSSLAPLGSAPQMIKLNGALNMEAKQEEPTKVSETLLGQVSDAPTSLARARFRKKAFDKLFTQRSSTPVLSPSNVYSFEFLQHLVNFQEYSIELGSMLGSVPLQESLDGQPIQIMATHKAVDPLWSFDIWHESIIGDAIKHDAK